MKERGRRELRDILVPSDGSEASLEAVAVACQVAKRSKGKVYVVHVIEVERALPLDAEMYPEAQNGEEILSRAEQVAEALDYEVEGELLQAREAGHAIADEAIERGVDGIILGIPYRRPFGEFQMGKTTQYLLKHAPCEIWIIRQAAPEGV
ncbi:MAG TPA: universal stress protein [Dehalococcoidia bacterium]